MRITLGILRGAFAPNGLYRRNSLLADPIRLAKTR